MHKLRGFVATSNLKFTSMFPCMSILRQWQRRTTLQLQKHVLQTTRKFQIQDQSQNSGLYLVTYVHNIMSHIRTFIIQN